MIRLVEGANPLDVADLLGFDRSPRKNRPGSATRAALAFRQAALTRSFACFDDDRCVAVGGLYDPGDGGAREAWFLCRPDIGLALRGVLRIAHLTLSKIVESERVAVHARVREGWRPGARIAAALGFRLFGVQHGYEIWVLK